MSTPVIVGIAGKIGSGKSEIGRRLREQHGFAEVNFADALKVEVGTRLRRTLVAYLRERGWIAADCEDEREIQAVIRRALYVDRTPVTRALLQEYGTEVRRADDEDYWTKQWSEQCLRLCQQAHGAARIVACDLRFENEAYAIRAFHGVTVRVTRPPTPAEPREHGFWSRLVGNMGFSRETAFTAPLTVTTAATHASETSLDGWTFDHEISNHLDLAWLNRCADHLAEKVIPPR